MSLCVSLPTSCPLTSPLSFTPKYNTPLLCLLRMLAIDITPSFNSEVLFLNSIVSDAVFLRVMIALILNLTRILIIIGAFFRVRDFWWTWRESLRRLCRLSGRPRPRRSIPSIYRKRALRCSALFLYGTVESLLELCPPVNLTQARTLTSL